MTNSKLHYFKNLFLEMLKDAEVNTTSNIEPDMEAKDEADLANRDRDQHLDLRLQGRNKFFIKKIYDALFRIETKEFGICEECGGTIEDKRLLARPMTTLCISCKENEERNENHILYSKRSHTLGKTFKEEKLVSANHENVPSLADVNSSVDSVLN